MKSADTNEVKEKKAKPAKKAAATSKVGKKMAAKKAAEVATATPSQYAILLRPVITEKGTSSQGNDNRAVFRVDTDATKDQIKAAVEKAFSVKVVAVNTVNYMGKPKRTTRSMGRRSSYKKAYVTLEKGQKINIIEGV